MIERILNLASETEKKAHVTAVFGEPQTVGDRTLIPVAEVRFGYAIGQCGGQPPVAGKGAEPGDIGGESGCGKMHGEGGAVGLVARPLAVIEVTADRMQVVPIVDSTRLTLAGMALGGFAMCMLAWMIHRLAR
jgi:uncharacterized spore protein YtfJ